MKPLLIFGLRGTLVERVYTRNVLAGMRAADLTVGVHKVWLRPHMLQTLLALQQHCTLAVWSSTTMRNTAPLMEAIFHNRRLLQEHLGSGGSSGEDAKKGDVDKQAATNDKSNSKSSNSSNGNKHAATANEATAAQTTRKTTSRFSKVKSVDAKAASATTTTPPASDKDSGATATAAATATTTTTAGTADEAAWQSPFKFAFVWTREHTSPDDLRRMHATVRDDEHATVKDVRRVFAEFATLSQPYNTVLIDDTPSKAKTCADNFVWLDTCEGVNVHDDTTMLQLRAFVEDTLLRTDDVRAVLPQRIRRTTTAKC